MRIVEGNWSDWSQALFDTGIYYEVWEGVNRITAEKTQQEVEGVKKLLEEFGVGCNAKILDVGGGYGRIAIPLAQAGERMHVLERSPLHCQFARQRAAEAGSCRGRLSVYNCDCRKIDDEIKALLTESGRADAAINIFTSVIGYYSREDDLAVLREVHELLEPNAPLIIDTQNLGWILRHFKDEGLDWASDRSWVQTEKRKYDPGLPGVISDYSFVHIGRDEMYNFETVHRMFDQASLALLLQEAGFEPQKFYGNWDFEEPHLDSKRVICVARKS